MREALQNKAHIIMLLRVTLSHVDEIIQTGQVIIYYPIIASYCYTLFFLLKQWFFCCIIV
jgi:hypothetical protein